MATRKVPPPDSSLQRGKTAPGSPANGSQVSAAGKSTTGGNNHTGLPDPGTVAEHVAVHKSFGPVERRILSSLHARDLPELERLLLYPDLNVHQRNLGRVALLASVKEGWAHVVRQLMRLGVDPNKAVKIQDVKNTGMSTLAADAEKGQLALVVAAQEGRADIIRALVDEGNADVNARNGEGWTALEAAAYWARDEAVRALVDRGATVVGSSSLGVDEQGVGWDGEALWDNVATEEEDAENAGNGLANGISAEQSVESLAFQTPAGSNLFDSPPSQRAETPRGPSPPGRSTSKLAVDQNINVPRDQSLSPVGPRLSSLEDSHHREEPQQFSSPASNAISIPSPMSGDPSPVSVVVPTIPTPSPVSIPSPTHMPPAAPAPEPVPVMATTAASVPPPFAVPNRTTSPAPAVFITPATIDRLPSPAPEPDNLPPSVQNQAPPRRPLPRVPEEAAAIVVTPPGYVVDGASEPMSPTYPAAPPPSQEPLPSSAFGTLTSTTSTQPVQSATLRREEAMAGAGIDPVQEKEAARLLAAMQRLRGKIGQDDDESPVLGVRRESGLLGKSPVQASSPIPPVANPPPLPQLPNPDDTLPSPIAGMAGKVPLPKKVVKRPGSSLSNLGGGGAGKAGSLVGKSVVPPKVAAPSSVPAPAQQQASSMPPPAPVSVPVQQTLVAPVQQAAPIPSPQPVPAPAPAPQPAPQPAPAPVQAQSMPAPAPVVAAAAVSAALPPKAALPKKSAFKSSASSTPSPPQPPTASPQPPLQQQLLPQQPLPQQPKMGQQPQMVPPQQQQQQLPPATGKFNTPLRPPGSSAPVTAASAAAEAAVVSAIAATKAPAPIQAPNTLTVPSAGLSDSSSEDISDSDASDSSLESDLEDDDDDDMDDGVATSPIPADSSVWIKAGKAQNRSELSKAVRSGSQDAVRKLLQTPGNDWAMSISSRDNEDGLSPVIHAAMMGDVGMVRLLLEAGLGLPRHPLFGTLTPLVADALAQLAEKRPPDVAGEQMRLKYLRTELVAELGRLQASMNNATKGEKKATRQKILEARRNYIREVEGFTDSLADFVALRHRFGNEMHATLNVIDTEIASLTGRGLRMMPVDDDMAKAVRDFQNRAGDLEKEWAAARDETLAMIGPHLKDADRDAVKDLIEKARETLMGMAWERVRVFQEKQTQQNGGGEVMKAAERLRRTVELACDWSNEDLDRWESVLVDWELVLKESADEQQEYIESLVAENEAKMQSVRTQLRESKAKLEVARDAGDVAEVERLRKRLADLHNEWQDSASAIEEYRKPLDDVERLRSEIGANDSASQVAARRDESLSRDFAQLNPLEDDDDVGAGVTDKYADKMASHMRMLGLAGKGVTPGSPPPPAPANGTSASTESSYRQSPQPVQATPAPAQNPKIATVTEVHADDVDYKKQMRVIDQSLFADF